MFKIRKSDMDKNPSNFIRDAVNTLRERDEGSNWESLVSAIKSVLDSRFGGDWNVMIGKTVGYAMKSRKKSSIILHNGSSAEIIVCWKSPGFEVEDLDAVKIKATLTVNDSDPLIDGAVEPRKTNIIQCPSPDTSGYSIDTTKATLIIDALADEVRDMDQQTAARHLRAHLTARLGTIWHVAVGSSRDFAIAAAKGCSDHIIAVPKKGGVKIELFRHTAKETSGLSSLSVPSMQAILETMPSVLFVVLCVAFIVQKSSLCFGENEKLSRLTTSLCSISFAIPLTPLAGLLFVLMVIKQVRRAIDRKNARLSSKKQV